MVKLDQDVQLVCLPQKSSSSYPSYDSKATILGWGSTQTGGDASDVLKNVNIQVYDPEMCSKVSYAKNWDSQICAGNYDGGIDSCQGK